MAFYPILQLCLFLQILDPKKLDPLFPQSFHLSPITYSRLPLINLGFIESIR